MPGLGGAVDHAEPTPLYKYNQQYGTDSNRDNRFGVTDSYRDNRGTDGNYDNRVGLGTSDGAHDNRGRLGQTHSYHDNRGGFGGNQNQNRSFDGIQSSHTEGPGGSSYGNTDVNRSFGNQPFTQTSMHSSPGFDASQDRYEMYKLP